MLSAARSLAAARGTNLGSQWVRLFSIGTTALPSGRAGAPAAGRGQTTEFGGDVGSVGGEGGQGGIRSEVPRVIGKTNTCKKVGSLRTYNCVGKKRDHPEGLPEICVIGRTNAGKSSLLNHLLNSRKMASASSRAGLTSEIDLYMVNGQFILADMPGYGFGDGSVRLNERWRSQWAPLIYSYLRDSPVKAAIFVADVRWVPTQEDVHITTALRECGVPTLLVMSKDDNILDKAADADSLKASGYRPNLARERPSHESSVAQARSWLAARVRERLQWPENLPHVHYSIKKPKGRKHLRRWIASFCGAADREEVQAMLDRALKRYTTEQDMIDKRQVIRTKIEGRENRYVERLRAERDARMEERGERESGKGVLYKPRVQDPKNIMDWDAKEVRMYKKAKRERRTEHVMRARYDEEVMRAKDES